jgi:hypothetical protein
MYLNDPVPYGEVKVGCFLLTRPQWRKSKLKAMPVFSS